MSRFQRKSKSPRWKAGSMLPDRTTTMGEGELVATERPFHSMKAVERMRQKFRSCERACRGRSWSRASIVEVDGEDKGESEDAKCDFEESGRDAGRWWRRGRRRKRSRGRRRRRWRRSLKWTWAWQYVIPSSPLSCAWSTNRAY